MTLASTVQRPGVETGAGTLGAAIIVSAVVAALAGWLSLNVMSTNVDVSWLLVAGKRLMEGAQLHRDIVETNPPFSIWLYMPLLYGEAATGLRAQTLLAFLLPLLALASTLLSGSILRNAGWFGNPASVWLLPVVVFVLSWLFPGDFGQREQIAAIVLLPWLALFAARTCSRDFAVGNVVQIAIAGVGAAVFVMIKPPMAALCLILPAAWFAVQLRSIRPVFTPETMIAAAIALFYVGWLLAFHRAFLTGVMPMVTEFYLPLRLPVLESITRWPLLVFATIALTTWLLARPAPMDRASLVLLLAAIGYVPGIALMGKAWTYQSIPILLFALIAFLIQFARSARAGKATPLQRLLLMVVAVQAVLVWYESLNSQTPPQPEHVAEIAGIAGPAPTVVSIAARLQAAHPLSLMIGARYLSQGPAMWLAHNAELLADGTADTTKRAEYLARRDSEISAAAASIVRLSPDLVIAGGSDPAPAEEAIMRDPEVQSALQRYSLLYRTADSTVFVRKDISPAR